MVNCLQRIFFLVLLFLGFSALPGQDAAAQDRRTHVVEPGETLFSISREYDLNVTDLRAWNDLDSNSIRAGMRLFVEAPLTLENTLSGQEAEATASDTPADSTALPSGVIESDSGLKPPIPGTVRRLDESFSGVIVGAGETLYSLAVRFAMPPDSLWELNSDLPSSIPAGAEIVVPSNRTMTRYTVRRGDTLFGIARDQGVSVDALRAANALTNSSLRIGQILEVPSAIVGFGDRGQLPQAGVFPTIVYPNDMDGRMLVSGRSYHAAEYIVSHPSLPMGSIVLVTIQEGDAEIFATVADRSMDSGAGMIEMSTAVAEALGRPAPGTRVSVHLID